MTTLRASSHAASIGGTRLRRRSTSRMSGCRARARALAIAVASVAAVAACDVPAESFLGPPFAQEDRRTPPDSAGRRDAFGSSVALSEDGSILAVGEQDEDSCDPDNSSNVDCVDSGAVYIYERTGAVWERRDYVKAAPAIPDARFGGSVALSRDGSVLAVGASGVDESEDFPGAVYVFERSGSKWLQRASWPSGPSTQGPNEQLGQSVALSADGAILAAGAPGPAVDGQFPDAGDPGKVHVYMRTGPTWDATTATDTKLSNPRGTPMGMGEQFGCGVALSADASVLAVSAPFGDNPGREGRVYMFTREGTMWQSRSVVMAENPNMKDEFGERIALSGDGAILAVGAHFEDGDGQDPQANTVMNSGAVYVFARDGLTWTWHQQIYLKAGNAGEGDFFGSAIALSASGRMLAVGARWEDSANVADIRDADDSVSNSGAAYVFTSDGTRWGPLAYLKADTGADGALGWSMALSADGGTLAVGSVRSAAGGSDMESDAVFVFRRATEPPESGVAHDGH